MKTHGMSYTRIYRLYCCMKRRCLPNAFCHERYYDRGIKVCDEWNHKHGFISFYKWAIENGYNDNLTLDRIDNNGNYKPNNCRWATYKEQGNNRENNHRITINGITKTLSQWSQTTGIPISCIERNVRKGWKGKKILTVSYHRKISKIAQYDLNGKMLKIWDSPIQAQQNLNLSNSNGIIAVCKKQNKTAYGYGWAYYPEDTWKPQKQPNFNEKKYITIDDETHDYIEWAKILGITRDSFRRICYKFNFDSKKLSEYKKKHLK